MIADAKFDKHFTQVSAYDNVTEISPDRPLVVWIQYQCQGK